MKKYLITGLLIWIPLAITIWVLDLIVSTMDQSLLLLPPQYQPQVLFGYQIPGIGALLTVVVVFVTGVLASNILGRARSPRTRAAAGRGCWRRAAALVLGERAQPHSGGENHLPRREA